MKKVRHVLRTKYSTPYGVIVSEKNVYYPKSKTDKIKTMGKDYNFGDTYKKTYNDGTRVLLGYGVKEHTGEIFIPSKNYKVQNKKYIKGGKK